MTDAASKLDELREVAVADVYKSGRLAGTLQRKADDVVFRYDPSYLSDPAKGPVAFSLPLIDVPTRATGGSVPPFFAGLLPEGLRLSALVSATRTSEDDHLTLLMAVGGDAIGDVQVSPAGQPPTVEQPAFDQAQSHDVSFAEVFARSTSTDPDQLERMALPGVQDKVSAKIISTPFNTSAGPAILKLSSDRFPQIVENEDFFLRMARSCGIPTPEHRVLHDRDGVSGLVVSRFDRIIRHGEIDRLQQEDACQVLGRYPSAKYRINLEDLIRGLTGAVHSTGGSRPLAVRRSLEIAAFSYVIGNGDLHGKNLSVCCDSHGEWGLTPAYDLLTTQPYIGWRDPMAVDLFGRATKLSRRWWLEAARLLGLPEQALSRQLDRIIESARPWVDRVSEIGFDDLATARLQELIAGRLRELER